jgi:hypothetical protein
MHKSYITLYLALKLVPYIMPILNLLNKMTDCRFVGQCHSSGG